MKSGKQRRDELREKRKRRAARRQESAADRTAEARRETPPGAVPVCANLVDVGNSYGVPSFVTRGFYTDVPFRCADCGREQIWTAAQQKWWYEVAKGYGYSTAKRCRECRERERERRAEARRIHLEGVARKRADARSEPRKTAKTSARS